MTKLAPVLATLVGRVARDPHGDRPMEGGQRSRIADLPATLPMLRLARALNAMLRWRPVRRAAPLGLLAAGSALALVVAACSGAYGGGAPAYSYPPPTSPSGSPAMSMSPTASEPVGSAAPAASVPASAAPGAAGSPPTIDATLHISARSIQFDTDQLEAPAGQAFVLEFDNNDPGVPHNVEIRGANGASVFKGQIITGPAKAPYQVPALAVGSYVFLCDVHPTMTGTLMVQ
jgi:plastocyanin